MSHIGRLVGAGRETGHAVDNGQQMGVTSEIFQGADFDQAFQSPFTHLAQVNALAKIVNIAERGIPPGA